MKVKMMRLPYELFVARRYLRTRRKTGFINTITYISILGVTIGVAALIIVLSVMNGFESEVRSRIIGFDTHIRLRTFHFQGITDYHEIIDIIKDIPHVVGLSPYIDEKGMIINKEYSDGVIIRGSDQNTMTSVSDIQKTIIYGHLQLGKVKTDGGKEYPGIVLGRYLADRLYLDVGDIATIMSPTGVRSLFQMPPVKQFVVTGYFETGMYEYDDAYAYISLESAQELFRYSSKVSGIEIRLDDLFHAEIVKKAINQKLGFPYLPQSWFDLRKNLFSWMQLEKWVMFIVLSLIVLVAAFNIISSLIMMVMEKTKEIGILKSMGATYQGITKIFLYEGLVVGIIGTVMGCLIGYGLCWAQQTYHFFSLPPDVYFINSLPVKMEWRDFILISCASIVICLTAAIYPARRAAKLDPVEAIRYE